MDDISLISKKQKERGLPRLNSFREPARKLSRGMRSALGAVAAVVIVAVGLFVWDRMLERTASALENERVAIIAERDAALEARVSTLHNLTAAYESLIRQHRNWSRIFSIIELRTVPVVTFTSFTGSYAQGTFELTGVSPNYKSVAQQIRSFEEAEQFTSVDVREIELNRQGEVEFGLAVDFKRDVITGPPAGEAGPPAQAGSQEEAVSTEAP